MIQTILMPLFGDQIPASQTTVCHFTEVYLDTCLNIQVENAILHMEVKN